MKSADILGIPIFFPTCRLHNPPNIGFFLKEVGYLPVMRKTLLGIIILMAVCSTGLAQQFTQTLRGTLRDIETMAPIPEATIMVHRVQDDSLIARAVTDENGEYLLENVEVGRVHITASAEAFTPWIKEDILITSAKEVVQDLELEPTSVTLDAVELTTNTLRGEPINRMSVNSAVTITPEQTSKFAGSWDDPMRVITAYPGVIQQNSGFNNFTIRGNSPVGMLYRLEGLPIHNPNHFAIIGSSGGFVTQFSSEVLGNSDFFSSVFPAEFGNATTAVFDFRFRKGNSEKREHTFKASLFGLDFATEGPFSKKSDASYLFNYRYSTLGILARVIPLGGVLPTYQDLSFNVDLPTKKGGVVKVFGVGGLSNYVISSEKDSTQWEEYSDRIERSFGSNSAAMGVALYQPVKDNGFFHAAAGGSVGQYFEKYTFIEDDLSLGERARSEFDDNRFSFTADYNHQFGLRHSNKTGVIFNHVDHRYFNALYDQQIGGLDTVGNTEGASQYLQAFTQSKFNLTDKLDVTAGVHYLHFMLNNKYSVDPRLGIIFKPNLKSKFSLAYGHHSRVEAMNFYFIRDEGGNLINENVGLSKAHHGVLSYSRMLTPNLKITTEAYYQHQYDVPSDTGAYSVLNLFSTLPEGELTNVGVGRNFGLEVMLHRFTKKGFYYMVSASLFDAQYKAGDGIWRNSEFNQRFSYNLLAGKEWVLKPKPKKKRLLGINFNFRHSGGNWFNPVDLDASSLYGWTRYDFSDPYSQQRDQLYNLDFTFTQEVIREKITGEFTLSIKNLYSNRAVIVQVYDIDEDNVRDRNDYGTIPYIGYKISF